MNTNPNAIRILCYGDSNTHGADSKTDKRFSANIRWTGVLQDLLGGGYEIIEEGLGGRTTIFEINNRPDRIGKDYLKPCVNSHNPFDVIIVSLGSNDFKDKNLSVKDIAEGNEELVKIIQENAHDKNNKVPKIVLVCPPGMDNSAGYLERFGLVDAEKKIKKLPVELQKIAEKYNTKFINLQEIVKPSLDDGLHLDPNSHKIIAEELFKKIKTQA